MKLTCTSKRKGRLVQVGHKWCGKLSRDNIRLYTICNLWEEPPFLPCGSLWGLHPNNTFSWASQVKITNWDSYCPKILDACFFLKSRLFGACKGNTLQPSKRSFLTVYGMPQLELILPLLSKDLWSKGNSHFDSQPFF